MKSEIAEMKLEIVSEKLVPKIRKLAPQWHCWQCEKCGYIVWYRSKKIRKAFRHKCGMQVYYGVKACKLIHTELVRRGQK